MPQLHPPPLLPQPMEAMPGALLGGPLEKPLVPDELQMAGMALPPGLDGAPKLQAQLPPDREDPIGPRAAGLLTGRLRGGLLAAAVGDRQRSSVAGEWGGFGGRGGSNSKPGFVQRVYAATLAQSVCQAYMVLAV